MHFLTCGLPENILRAEASGNFSLAKCLIDQWLADERTTELQKARLSYEKERIERILKTYPYDEEEAFKIASEQIEGFSRKEFEQLIEQGKLDFIFVDGKRKFEKRFVQNLGFSMSEYKSRMKQDEDTLEARKILDERIKQLLNGDNPKVYRIRAKVMLKVKNVEKKSLRVWLPFPKVGLQVLDVRLISASKSDYYVSANNSPQRTIYFEGVEDEYWVEFEYKIKEWVNKVDLEKVSSSVDPSVQRFLAEEPPHIVFTPYLRYLANQIVKSEKNPYLKAKLIYDWITKNVRYSYVKPYATYENISQYVAENLKGDCGFQALLFITLCRIEGIPARWQSGWYANPIFASPHDWALFYVEPYGWLPADLSFGGARRNDENMRNFYFGNLDAFRMVANDDFMKDFDPPTRYHRDDPTDNQVGEAEFEDGKAEFESELEIISFEEEVV
ncbi:transglutaminase domain-containing protein [Pseudothermotoga thermarum]|uniref:Transglutaminase domain-containing protein n=1 Tax=Pseudothermotoga thermarum DSM 5069 TaxID=688269 RepID=F7YY67_9THEM|nr:transglutaminase domain-containing protein [Pseudothermotoga thermarum]AEH50883.1 transglutaminase domain-containing protein [Pseudothermotoga thermarum DSM 5069]